MEKRHVALLCVLAIMAIIVLTARNYSTEPKNPIGTANPTIVSQPTSVEPQDALVDWSYTDNPVVDYFNAERDILGVEFELIHNSDSNQYEFKGLMGDCDKIISYTLTGTGFTVVLNGKYDLMVPGNPDPVPASVGINKTVNESGDETMEDWYTKNPPSIVEGKDGNYSITVPFDKVYKKGGITYVRFTFGKID